MFNNCEQKILEILIPRPFEAYSIRRLSKIIKIDYSLVHKSIMSLIRKDMIKTKEIGRSTSCQLNLSADPDLLAISSMLHYKRFMNKKEFSYVFDEIKHTLSDSIYIMLLFGSHAKGTAKKDSDIDLLFVVQNENDIKKIKRKINNIISETNYKIEFEVITTNWLIKMFEEKNTVGREVLKGSIIIHGADQYYTMVNIYDKKRGH